MGYAGLLAHGTLISFVLQSHQVTLAGIIMIKGRQAFATPETLPVSFSSVSAKPANVAPKRRVLMVCSVSVAQGEAVHITASLTAQAGIWRRESP